MNNATYQTAADVFDGWRDDVLTGSPPVRWPVGTGELARLEIGPGLVTLIGGQTRRAASGVWRLRYCNCPNRSAARR